MRWRATLVALAVLLAGCGAVFGPAESRTTETVTPAPVPEPEARHPESAVAPGLSGQSVADADRLAQTHLDAVENRSYTWTQRRIVAWPAQNRSLVDLSHLLVESERRYRYETRSQWSRVDAAEYADGRYRYSRARGAGGVRYQRGSVTNATDRFGGGAAASIRRYLAVENATVTAVRAGGERRYRVVGRADSIPTLGTVENYTVRAVVSSDGFVQTLHAAYTTADGDDRQRVSYRFRYTNVGTTTVSPPAWVDREWAGVTPADNQVRAVRPPRARR
ncbi:DUF7537 family lipoprotein [Halomicrobium urmianum]|uniref:DUF7537 family lipoprotein n=1 Tax=Halomicrobium urmianum TaxID=1586233 RepID=UPI001CDA089B|nr:hypothetical protein [Halomicrobium urmianum]